MIERIRDHPPVDFGDPDGLAREIGFNQHVAGRIDDAVSAANEHGLRIFTLDERIILRRIGTGENTGRPKRQSTARLKQSCASSGATTVGAQ